MIYPKQNFEQWQQDYKLYVAQHTFAAEQCSTYEHLMSTQSTAGNLPKALEKWAVLRSNCLKAIEQHIDRGCRWQVLNKELELHYKAELEKISSKAV